MYHSVKLSPRCRDVLSHGNICKLLIISSNKMVCIIIPIGLISYCIRACIDDAARRKAERRLAARESPDCPGLYLEKEQWVEYNGELWDLYKDGAGLYYIITRNKEPLPINYRPPTGADNAGLVRNEQPPAYK
ncbi:unnamed protein product [Owenia fusiformis]|uniref:Uncharacterized protein n=1 Tax=Owenia fusiformis TaxID=6347 RepID=A0A8S4N859_OWEFU|nr:unnamed protein product [Owenia fusiformis]